MNHSQVPRVGYGSKCVTCDKPGTEQDHALFSKSPQRRTKEWRNFLDSEYNLNWACHECNVAKRRTDTWQSRRDHVESWMEKDAEGFGEWLDSFPGSRAGGSRWDEVNIMMESEK